VVALQVVVHDELPVRVDLVGGGAARADPVERHVALRDDRRELAERVLERPRALVRIDEHERPPDPDRRPGQGDVLEIEVRRPRRGPQPPVEPVGPGVVVALQRAAPSVRLPRDDGAAVTADVHERAQVAALVPRHDDRHPSGPRRQEGARLRDQLGGPRVLPAAVEDVLELAVERVGPDVPVGGESLVRLHGAGEIVPLTTHEPTTESKSTA
jgi:hypothetical protein